MDLEAVNRALAATVQKQEAELKAADAQIMRLRSALEPFAGMTHSKDYIKNGPDDGWCAAVSYQVKHYRAARAALGGAMKLNINEERFLAAVDREGDHEIGAGALGGDA